MRIGHGSRPLDRVQSSRTSNGTIRVACQKRNVSPIAAETNHLEYPKNQISFAEKTGGLSERQ